MKKVKKLLSLIVAAVMVIAMAVPAFAAAQTYTITAPSGDHEYEIYQIFTGDLSDGVLSNVKWGENGTGTKGAAVDKSTLDALTAVNSKSDKDKLTVIEQYAILSNPVATISNGATYTADAGYYLIKDKDKTVSGTDVYTTYIVKVVGNVTIKPKGDVPQFDKKIKDTNDTTGATSDWQDSADYDIGDRVPFKLEGTVASNYDVYNKYYYAFHDKEEEGLTFDKDSVKVYVDGKEITSGFEVKTSNLKDNDCTFEVVFEDLKQISGVKASSKITVEYNSVLNDKAKLGNQGNVNSGKLEFSNNPNDEQGGTPAETPWDNVIVFTYKVVVNKTDADGKALKGAAFKLEKVNADGSKTLIATVDSIDENTVTFEFKGLDDGDYILTETATPSGYNSIDPIGFTVTADHKIEWKDEGRTDLLTSLTGNTESGEITFTSSEDKGTLTTNIVNQKGSTLPSTGGMGTKILYTVGVILVLGAGIVLVTRKRVSDAAK